MESRLTSVGGSKLPPELPPELLPELPLEIPLALLRDAALHHLQALELEAATMLRSLVSAGGCVDDDPTASNPAIASADQLNSEVLNAQVLNAQVRSLQVQFQQFASELDVTQWPQAQRVPSVLVECHRLLKLLITDALFLQAARTPGTRQARSQQMGDRLQQLLGFLTVMGQWWEDV